MRRIKTRILALASAMALSPAAAFASGNTLSLTSPTWDTATPAPVSTAALSGGYGVTAPGACYSTPDEVGQFPETLRPGPTPSAIEKSIWFRAPTALPSTPQLIFGDDGLYIAENTAGNLVFGSGSTFVVSTTILGANNVIIRPGTFNDGAWHRVVVMVYGGPLTGGGILQAWIDSNSYPFGAVSAQPIYSATNSTEGPPGAGMSIQTVTAPAYVTGIRGNPAMLTTAGSPVGTFAGEVDEAECSVPAIDATVFNDPVAYASPYALPTGPLANATQGILGLWHLASSGADSATWAAAVYPPQSYVAPPPGGYVPPPNPNVTPPSGGFPIQ